MANAATIDTGHGATLTLSVSLLALDWTSIDLGEETINDIETTKLDNPAYHSFMPGDLITASEVTVPFWWDTEQTTYPIGQVETATFTFPLGTGQTAEATYAGTGYIKRIKYPNLQTDAVQDGELTWKFDGLTGPTFTPATIV